MKKTRILAALLCLVMIVCSLPIVASAKLKAIDYNTIGGLIGATSTVPVDDPTWFSMNFDFKDNFSQTDGITKPDGVTYDNENGMNFPAEYVTWKYFPSGSTQWSPLVKGAYTIRLKLDAGGSVELQACELYSHDRSFVIISETGITAFENDGSGGFRTVTNTNEFAAGNDWIDVVVATAAPGYSVYAKKATDTEFTHVVTTTDYRPGGGWKSTGMTVSGKSAYVSDLVMLEPSDTLATDEEESDGSGSNTESAGPAPTELPYAAVGKVLGGEYSEPNSGNTNWGAMNLVFTDNFSSTTEGVTVPAGMTFDNENGAVMPLSATAAPFYYKASVAYQNYWSPMNLGNWGIRFRLDEGGSFVAQAVLGWSVTRAYVTFKNDEVTTWTQTDGSTKVADYAPGTDWNDALIVTNADKTYDVYMKKATDSEFTKVITVTNAQTSSTGQWRVGAEITGNGYALQNSISYQLADAPTGGGEGGDSGSGDTTGNGAAPTVADLNAAGEAVGMKSIVPDEELTFDFVGAGTSYEQPDGVETATNLTYQEAGLTFGADQGIWKYNPSVKWCPFSYGSVIYFKSKVAADGSVILQAYWPEADHYRIYLDIRSTGIAIHGASGITTHVDDFVPGTDYVEYMVHKDQRNQVIYAKGGNKSEWTKIYTATTWRTSGYNCGLHFTGQNAVIPYAAVATPSDTAQGDGAGGGTTPSGDAYDGTQGKITDVLGSDAVIIKEMQFSSDYDTAQAGVTVPSGATLDDGKGMRIPAAKNFTYLPESGYTPLAYKGMTAGIKVSAGESFIIQLKNPTNNSQRTYVEIKSTSVWVCQGNGEGGFAGSPNIVEYVPGTDWNDYLITVNENGGYNVYAKPQGDESWTLFNSTTSYRPGGSAGMGAQFYASTGNNWIKYFSVYGTEDQLPEPEGPEAGTKMTIEDIIGGIAVAKEQLIFDSNFNGIEANAQLKNVQSGEVADEQPAVTANGLELVQTAGKFFAWNSGSENAWKPLAKTNPVMFRAKLDAGSMLDVQLNGYPRASLYLYPEKLIVQGTGQTQAKDFAPGTGWVNYLVTHDGSNFMVWTKADGETEWTLRVTSNGFRTAGFYGVLFANTTANKVTISEVKQYKIERMVLTDANTIATMTNRVYIDEDFSEDTGMHAMITGKFEGGVFKRDPDAEPHASYPNASRLDVDLSQVNPKGQWFIRFKYRIPTADSVMSLDMVNNGNKIAIDCHDDYVFIINRTSGVGKSDTAAAAGVGNWAELLFSWTDNAYVDVYWHKVGDDEWIKTHTKFVPGSEANDKLAFHCKLDAELDDVKVYSGDYLRVDEPTLESGVVKTSGEYFSGTLESKYDRRATLIAAVYDETYGYTKFVKSKDYEVLSGRGANLANTFVTEGVDETKDTAAVMLWDTLETGIPLGDMAGAALANNATGSAGNAEVGVTVEANYNDVRVTGYTGIKNGRVTISVVDENGVLKAVGQTTSSGTGLVDASVAVAPSSATGTYTVRVQYGTTEATASTVELFCDDIPYNSITDVASMRSFINSYGSETAKKWNAEESFAADVYARFQEEKGSITTFATLYDFRDVMDVATDAEIHERQFCLDVNTAAASGKWSEVQNLVLDGTLGLTVADLSGISDKKALFLRMTGGYTSEHEVLAGFQTALAAQKTAEASGSGAGGGTGGGAGGGVASDNKYTQTGAGVSGGGFGGSTPEPVEKPTDFTDLEGVEWATESIQALRSMGIINGNGDGTFAPNRAVTREEFLKMVLQAAGITAKADGAVTFRDVDADAWYYAYVVTAYQAGIITGLSEEEFGIGQQITRADMAVMIKRILDYKNIEMETTVTPYVFADFDTIPRYAEESVDALVRAGLMNGVGNNKFAGTASATRAEAAVAIYRIYNYMAERR